MKKSDAACAHSKTEMSRLYPTMDDAARAWARKHLPESAAVERGALIYRRGEDYFLGETFIGETPTNRRRVGLRFPPNVIKGFLRHYFKRPEKGARLCGFIHSHPKNCSNLPSAGDRLANLLPFIKREYIAAYSPKYGAHFGEDASLPCYCISDYKFKKNPNGGITARRR